MKLFSFADFAIFIGNFLVIRSCIKEIKPKMQEEDEIQNDTQDDDDDDDEHRERTF